MKISITILYKVALFFFLFLGLKEYSIAQKVTKIEILRAASLEYDENLGQKARRLVGDVAFKHDNAVMTCDSAYIFSEINLVKAYGHIHINQADTVNLYGDSLLYNSETKKANVLGNVKLIDKGMTLTSNNLDYDMKNDFAFYSGGGKIVSTKNKNVLTSDLGYYYSGSKMLFFKNNVVLVNPEIRIETDTLKFNTISEIAYFHGPTSITGKKDFIYCENGWYNTKKDLAEFSKNSYLLSTSKKLSGDSLFYDRIAGIGKAIKNIEIIDTTDKIIINGEYAIHYEKTNNSMVTGNMLLTMIMEEDSLFLHADTLLAIGDPEGKNKKIHAYRKVKFFKNDMSGMCDSLSYNVTDSLIKMYREPVLWNGENQITADTISIKTFKGKIDKLFMENASFIISKNDSVKYNQIKGKNMVAEFADNKLYKVNVTGNGQTLYYAKEENGDYIGMNKAESSDLIIYIKNKTVDKLTFIQKPDAILLPLEKVNSEEALLKGFKWLGDSKPLSKTDIFK